MTRRGTRQASGPPRRVAPIAAGWGARGRGQACSAALVALTLIGLSSSPGPAEAQTSRDKLWQQVQTCLREQPLQLPCVYVSQANKYVILKDINPAKPQAYLIVPADKVTGIEDKQIWSPPVLNFWEYGWQESKRYLKKQPPENTGLAINSVAGRDQDQLHIHISCVKKSVRDALAKATAVTDKWGALVELVSGHKYNVRKVTSLSTSPFTLLGELPPAKDHMKDQTLAVIGAKGGGFYVLNDYTHADDKGEAEELLDEKCQ